MPNTSLIIRAKTAVTGLVLVVDGFPAHRHTFSSRTGSEPLEDGREVVDHVVALPETATLSGFVGDIRGMDRPERAFSELQRIWRESEPVRVIHEWGVLDEAIIKRAEPQGNGRGMTFELELQQILRVGVEDAGIPPSAMTGAASGRSAVTQRGRVAFEIDPGGRDTPTNTVANEEDAL